MKRFITWINLFAFIWYMLIGNTSFLYAQDSKKITIAVLSINSKGGVSNSEAATLADRLRSELVNLDRFSVAERGQMDAILTEQGFSQSGCVSSECAIEAGRLLGVRLMVTGDVGKIGNVLTIDVRMFDVSTGKIIRAIQEDYKGDVAGLLGVMKTIAHRLAGQKQKTKKEGGFPWLWVTLGAVVIGGGAIALLSGGGGDGDDGDITTSLPDPIWPPSK